MTKYEEVFENNRKWVEENTARDPDFFKRLADQQHPDFLFIGCADSRVPANEIMGLQPGEVFVHRNVANLVVNTDINAQSVIEYAVGHLDVAHVVAGGVGAHLVELDPAPLEHRHVLAGEHIGDLPARPNLDLANTLEYFSSQHDA